MRNLYRRLGIDQQASAETIHKALDQCYEVDPGLADETAAILLDTTHERQYARVHRQFQAAAALIDQLGELPRDDHRWHRRLREFQSEE